MTPLLYAITHGSLEIVEMLLDEGADIQATDTLGTTSLMLAVEHGIDMVQLLIERGCPLYAHDQFGRNVFYYLSGTNHEEELMTFFSRVFAVRGNYFAKEIARLDTENKELKEKNKSS